MNYFLETFESNNFCQHIFYDNLNPLKNTQCSINQHFYTTKAKIQKSRRKFLIEKLSLGR